MFAILLAPLHSHCSCQSTLPWTVLSTTPLLVFLPWSRSGWKPISGQDTTLPSHWHTTTHRSFMSKKSVQVLHPWIQIRTSYMRSFTPFSDRNVTLVSSPKNDQPGTHASLQAGYSCGMGPGVGHRLKRWQHLFSCHFDLCAIQIMWFNREQRVLHEHAEIWCALIFLAL